MSQLVLGDGPVPCDRMIVGERPGHTEAQRGKAFVGEAGEELWSRIWRVLRMTRDDFYVTNLVKTFSQEPPSDEEIARDAPMLKAEILKVRPKVIITIGYHAARWFLPQFKGVNGDVFHGLTYPYQYGRLIPRRAVVVPVVHAAAALRQPDRYQNQLSADLLSVGRVLQGEQGEHRTRSLRPYRVGLAGFGQAGHTLGLDTEGSTRSPECVTLTRTGKEVACIEVWNGTHKQFLKPSIEHAKRLVIHHAKHDIQVLQRMGILDARSPSLPRVEDTMIMAYLLGLPQGLKTLAYRELGYVMRDYEDLVGPLDEQIVRQTMQQYAAAWAQQHEEARTSAEAKAEYRAKVLGCRKTQKMVKKILERLLKRTPELPPLRVVASVQRMLANV